MEALFILVPVVVIFGPWVLIFILFNRVGDLRSELDALRKKLAGAEAVRPGQKAAPQKKWGEWPETAEPDDQRVEEARAPEEPRKEASEEPPEIAEAPAAPDAGPSEEPVEEKQAAASMPAAARRGTAFPEAGGAERAHVASTAESLERSLASRWLVWLGGIALACAGVFLTAYAIEQGWLGPRVRIALGVLLGLALAIGGEWLRRRPFEQAIAAIRPDYVPPALSAAGIFTIYASIYVGYAFYDLYPALAAFFMLAIAGLAAIALSLLQGWFVALLGILGSFVTPALIPSDAPSALALFSYLAAVLAAACAVVRYRAWWLLGYAALIPAALWSGLWFISAFDGGDTVIVGVYALIVGALYQAIRYGLPQMEAPPSLPLPPRWFTSPEALGWAGLLAAGLMIFALVRVDGYTAAALAVLGVFVVASLWLARREPFFDLAFVHAGLLTCLLFVLWHLPYLTDPGMLTYPDQPGLKVMQPVPNPPPATFTRAVLVFGTLFGLGGFLSLWGNRRASVFAGVSAIVPVVLFTIAYWRYLNFDQNVYWAAVALILAGLALGAAAIAARRRADRKWLVATGLYAAAVIACIGLGFAMTLEEAWLTVALAVQLPALAWVDSRLNIAMLRRIAEVVAVVVLIRLIGNPAVLDYALAPGTLFNWILYGYGIPCLAFAFAFAARTFAGTTGSETRSNADERLPALLQAGALVFLVLLVSFQIRYWVSGSLDALYDDFLEQCLQSLAWLAIAYVLMARGAGLGVGRWPVLEWGARLLLSLSAAQVLLAQIWLNNPFSPSWMPEEQRTFIGEWPILDYLLLAYLAPAGFALAFAFLFKKRSWQRLALAAGIAALVLLFVYVSVEVRHWFQGATLQWAFVSDAESYAVSAAWLVLALALLAAGILSRSHELRYASLAVLLLAVAKVFLFDAADLEGLYRVAAFLGLGFSLVGIGYVYQRFVFAETTAAYALESEDREGENG
jgi:uncharacterized membrane protein